MVESYQGRNFFMLAHLGAGLNISVKRPQKLKEKRLFLKKALNRANELAKGQQVDSDQILLNLIQNIETSNMANAGYGCNLTCEGTAELDASYARVQLEKNSYASVTAVDYSKETSATPGPPVLAKALCDDQALYSEESFEQRPPLMICGLSAFKYFNIQHSSSTENENPYVNGKKLRTLKKKSLKGSTLGPGDTIGGLVIDSNGTISLCTSSGGHWLKPPGRVGSSAIRGSGFDFKNNDSEVFFALASGHGENIIEQ